jgi:tripartite-type tricarboxylate transporter receptor subunit TctC
MVPVAMQRYAFAAVAFILALAEVRIARAADQYPSRSIRLVVGFGAGGPTDIPARFVADRLGKALGQPVVVENKPASRSRLTATRCFFARISRPSTSRSTAMPVSSSPTSPRSR